jgi:hypothetical protein
MTKYALVTPDTTSEIFAVVDTTFQVNAAFYWVECTDDIVQGQHEYHKELGLFTLKSIVYDLPMIPTTYF